MILSKLPEQVVSFFENQPCTKSPGDEVKRTINLSIEIFSFGTKEVKRCDSS